MWEAWVQSLGWENPPEEVMAAHSSILAWRIPMDRGARRAKVHGVAKSRTQLSDYAQHRHTGECNTACCAGTSFWEHDPDGDLLLWSLSHTYSLQVNFKTGIILVLGLLQLI